MRTPTPGASSGLRSATGDGDLLLRETNHRCANDLQLVVSLLGLTSRRVESEEARAALGDVAERVAILARARTAITQRRDSSLETALRQVCEALQPHAEPRSILISLHVEEPQSGLRADRVTTLALVVNELVTNAIKHAFQEGASGRIAVAVGRSAGGDVMVTVDDDGLPYPEPSSRDGSGLGLGLARRLMASIGGLLIAPAGPTKIFELRVPSVDGQVPA